MEEPSVCVRLSVLDVLAVWPCARAIFGYVPVHDLVRSERVSTEWQHAVHDYLHASRNLKLHSGDFSYLDESDHRIIEIEDDERPWSVLRKTTEKLGSYILSVKTTCGDAEHVRIIETNSPHLQHVGFYGTDSDVLTKLESFKELKQVSLIGVNNLTDCLLLHPFQVTEFEKVVIEESEITGNFLKYIKTDNLKSLSINECPNLQIGEFQYIAENLQNLTSLQLDGNGLTLLQNVHELLTRLPRLENLSLREYEPIQSCEKLLESLSCLSNLKRLNMGENKNVSDELIEVVVRDCGKLEYLDITNVYDSCARSLAALWRRRPPAHTTLSMGYVKNFTSDDLWYITSRSVIPELEALGCLELTPEWLEETERASRGREHPLELRSYQPGEKPIHELKIILDSTNMTMERYVIGGMTVNDLIHKYDL